MHRSWVKNGPCQDRCMCIVLFARTDTAASQTSPGVRSDLNFEASPAVAARASQKALKGEDEGRVAVSVRFLEAS
eukprot:6089596-Pyramimonas_sp.AAC.1